MTPEAKARVEIDKLLVQAGWHVCGMAAVDIHAAQGVAIREFPLNKGFGFADYLLYVNGKACGVNEHTRPAALELLQRAARRRHELWRLRRAAEASGRLRPFAASPPEPMSRQ